MGEDAKNDEEEPVVLVRLIGGPYHGQELRLRKVPPSIYIGTLRHDRATVDDAVIEYVLTGEISLRPGMDDTIPDR